MKAFFHEDGRFELIASERNLLSLLDKLYWDSARELQAGEVYDVDAEGTRTLRRQHNEERTVSLKAESDEEHYADRPARIRGLMHPRTELALHRLRRAAAEEGGEQ